MELLWFDNKLIKYAENMKKKVKINQEIVETEKTYLLNLSMVFQVGNYNEILKIISLILGAGLSRANETWKNHIWWKNW